MCVCMCMCVELGVTYGFRCEHFSCLWSVCVTLLLAVELLILSTCCMCDCILPHPNAFKIASHEGLCICI